MTSKLLLFFIFAFLEITNGQNYETSYQPYNYYPSAPTAASMTSAYPTSMYSPPALMAPSYLTTFATNPSPMMPPASLFYAPFPPVSTFATPIAPTNYQQSISTLNYSPIPAIPVPKYLQSPKSTSTPKLASIGLPAPKFSPPTAIAYYLTNTQPEVPKATSYKEKVKENVEKLPVPTYHCPYCTGFKNVPKNSKVPPPPPCASVLPGILDKIPTIALPDKLKIKELGKLKSPPLLADLFEHKLSGKLRFDQDLLDGFLTGLGLESCDD